MIKILQRKFIFAAMFAVSILLIASLGTINLANTIMTSNQTDNLLDEIITGELNQSSQPPNAPNNINPGSGPMRFSERNMSFVFFVARVNNSGEVVQLDISRITTMTEDEAENITLQAIELSENSGKISGFKYTSMNDGIGKVYVFLDVSYQTYSVLTVLFLSVLIGLICWVLMLILVIFLSKKAIKPIAENIERQKQFVTDAGHEIKTPLAIILANTDALELHNGENKWSKNIRAQTIRLSGLMQNLLTLAKIDESNIDATKESFSLNEIIDRTSDMFQEMLIPKNLILQKYYSADIVICANKELITRLVSILLDNAVKYSPCDGRIQIELYKNDKTINLVVANKCDSLPDCPPEKLFDRFYRGDSARTQKGGGYGIGLSAARSIAEIHGGSIKANYGNDNTIIFTVEFKI